MGQRRTSCHDATPSPSSPPPFSSPPPPPPPPDTCIHLCPGPSLIHGPARSTFRPTPLIFRPISHPTHRPTLRPTLGPTRRPTHPCHHSHPTSTAPLPLNESRSASWSAPAAAGIASAIANGDVGLWLIFYISKAVSARPTGRKGRRGVPPKVKPVLPGQSVSEGGEGTCKGRLATSKLLEFKPAFCLLSFITH